MSNALTLTGRDLVRALAGASSAVDRAARQEAEDVARIMREETGLATRVTRRESGDYRVSIEGPGLFAREFGTVDGPGEAVVTRAIAGMKR